jgi:hypothetical protein
MAFWRNARNTNIENRDRRSSFPAGSDVSFVIKNAPSFVGYIFHENRDASKASHCLKADE